MKWIRSMLVAEKHGLAIIEDNAHGLFGKYKGRFLGTLGDMATQSFHETKNITCGEGGALLINEEKYNERAEIIREKGTNRSRFYRGMVDKYTWVDNRIQLSSFRYFSRCIICPTGIQRPDSKKA